MKISNHEQLVKAIRKDLMSMDGMDRSEWLETIDMAIDGELDGVVEYWAEVAERFDYDEEYIRTVISEIAEGIKSSDEYLEISEMEEEEEDLYSDESENEDLDEDDSLSDAAEEWFWDHCTEDGFDDRRDWIEHLFALSKGNDDITVSLCADDIADPEDDDSWNEIAPILARCARELIEEEGLDALSGMGDDNLDE